MTRGQYERTEAHREYIRKKLTGYKHSAQTKSKMSEARKKVWQERKSNPDKLNEWKEAVSKSLKGKYTGEKAAGWRGGKSFNKRNDRRIDEFRRMVLLRDSYTCQLCYQRGGDMHIDHIQTWSDYPSLRFEVSNGRTICRPCHFYLTFKRKMPKGSRWGERSKLTGVKDIS